MNFLYNIGLSLSWSVLKIVAVFNRKIHLFVNGRREIYDIIADNIFENDKVIWFHCASLGEFEQGRPIIERIKQDFSEYKIALTFFSPSGYEIRKNYELADVVTYLPWDNPKKVKLFLHLLQPKMAIFVKYEFWPNILKELKIRQINTLLVSGIFRENQIFFKNYGNWMRRSLSAFTYFFLQNETSKRLLDNIGFINTIVSGDTRFDRVWEISKQNNELDILTDFTKDKFILVAGSTWPKDEELLVNYINNNAGDDEKFIIAPHNISEDGIEKLRESINVPSAVYTKKNKEINVKVFIIDTIGILTKVYSYADVAYVGGGFGTSGVHNILEPAAYGIPIIIGPNFNKFKEAIDLVELKACRTIQNKEEFAKEYKALQSDENYCSNIRKITMEYIENNVGATEIILNYISKFF